jgi:hypothetical protein
MNTLRDYQQLAYQSVDKLFRNIEQLKQKGKYISQKEKRSFSLKVAELDEKKENLRRKFNQLATAPKGSAEEIKTGFEQARQVLDSAWKKAKQDFVT